MRIFTGARKIVIFVTALNFSAHLAGAQTFEIKTDAFTAAQQHLEAVKSSCYPNVDVESLIVPEFSMDGVLSEISIGLRGNTTAYVINPQNLVCGEENAGLCGFRGCSISIFAGEYKFLYTGWRPEIVSYRGNNLILLPQSGWACHRSRNTSPCFSIVSWDDTKETFVYNYEQVFQ
jgi:hypothetical protein